MSRFPQFSIATLLILMALVAVSISHLRTTHRLHATRDENLELRNQLGMLTIDDQAKVHVLAIPTPENNAWRWRIHVPRGVRLRLGIADDGVIPLPGQVGGPGSGAKYFEDPVSSGEHLLDAKLYRDGDGLWTVTIRTPEGAMTYSLRSADVYWLDGTAFFRTRAGSPVTREFAIGASIPLLRHVVVKHELLPKPPTPNPGIMIWLESAIETPE